MTRRHALLALMLLMLSLAATARAEVTGSQPSAPDDLMLGGLSLDPLEGYGGYALPIANSALGRHWARSGELAWQMAYDYSAAPVVVRIEHRQAGAFYGRIELETTNSYATEESVLQEPTLYVHEFVAPPSVLIQFAFTPRLCPPSVIGGPVSMKLRLYRQGTQRPLKEYSFGLMQLEPAWLYGLHLDDPLLEPGSTVEPDIYEDAINAGNALKLQIADVDDPYGMIYSTKLYTIPVARESMTYAPLAARNFAFVFADAARVRQWPAAEQQALLQYMLAGGYLCLYGASGEWQGLKLDAAPQQVARGELVTTPGDFNAARALARRWLTGELEEFTLLCGGLSGAHTAPLRPDSEWFAGDFDFAKLFAVPEGPDPVPSHAPGFLHPLWIYRQAARNAALEPWDNPEFSRPAGQRSPFADNLLLRHTFNGSAPAVPALAELAAEGRSVPRWLYALACVLPLAFLLYSQRRAWHVARATLIALTLAAGTLLFAAARPEPAEPLSLALYDQQAGIDAAAARTLDASLSDRSGSASFALDSGALLRRVVWPPAGPWSQLSSDGAEQWQGRHGGPFVAVAADVLPDAALPVPVELRIEPATGGGLRIDIDATALPPGTPCVLLLPLGWSVIDAGSKSTLYVESPQITAWPGYARLEGWQRYSAEWQLRAWQGNTMLDEQNEALLRLALGPAPQWTELDALTRLGLGGVLQDPLGFRAALGEQAVLFVALPDATAGTARFMRVSYRLEPAQ